MRMLLKIIRHLLCFHRWEPDRKAIVPSGVVGIKCHKCGVKQVIYETVREKY